jgi:hypothetical protein
MNPYVIGGGVAIIAVMGFLLKGAYERNGELEVKLKVQAEQTVEAVDANATNMGTIRRLEKRINTMIESRRVDTVARERLLVEREADLLTARAENDILREAREDEQDENADCKDLSGLRVDFFCPATADQLRQRSRGPGSNGDADSN